MDDGGGVGVAGPAAGPGGHRERAVPSSIGGGSRVVGGRMLGGPGCRVASRPAGLAGAGSWCVSGAGAAGAGSCRSVRSWAVGGWALPPRGSTSVCARSAGNARPSYRRRSGFLGFDRLGALAALELGDERVEELAEHSATSPASARRREGSGSRQARQIASRSFGTLGFRARRAGPRIDRIRIPRHSAGEQLEQDRPEAEDVRRDRSLRGPARSRGDGHAESGDPGDQLATILLAEMAQLGIHEPGRTRRREQDPVGVEAPVVEAQPVGLVHGAGERLDDLGRRQHGERTSSVVLGEFPSLHVFGGQEFGPLMMTGREDGDDVRVMQPRRAGVDLDVARVAGRRVPPRLDHLEGDATIPGQLPSLVDHARPPASQDAEDRVAGEGGELRPPRIRIRAVARRRPRRGLSRTRAADRTSQPVIIGSARGVVMAPPAVALRTNEFLG